MADQTLTEAATKVLPPESPQPEAASAPVETPEQRSERMRKIAQRPRGPRKTVRQGTPAWLRRLMDEVDALREHALLKRYDRELRAELKAAELTASEAMIRLAVRQRTLMEMTDACAFHEQGGPVHRRRRRLHDYLQQRDDLVSGWLQLRLKLGLDSETVTRPMTFSDSFRELVKEGEGGPTAAEQLAAARARVSEWREKNPETPLPEPAALLEGPTTLAPIGATPSPVPAPDEPGAGPVLELLDEPAVVDMGYEPRRPIVPPAAPAPAVPFVSTEPRFRPHVGRIPGTNLYTDGDGYVMPSPFDDR